MATQSPQLPTLNQALTNVTAAEATYNADQQTVVTIQASIATATAPLAPAQAQVQQDLATYIGALQVADQVIQAQIAALQAPTTTGN